MQGDEECDPRVRVTLNLHSCNYALLTAILSLRSSRKSTARKTVLVNCNELLPIKQYEAVLQPA